MNPKSAAPLVLIGILALGACQADAEPEPQPPPSPPTSSSAPPTPSSDPSPSPALWEENSTKGARAFVKHWFATFSDAQRTGDVERLRSLSRPGCKTCTNFADMLETLYRNGGSYRSNGWHVTRMIPERRGLPPHEIQVLTYVRESEETIIESPGAEPISNPAGDFEFTARVRWANGGWTMSRLVLLT